VISILYVDDELQLLDMVKEYLERSGEFSVHTTTSVKSAIELLDHVRAYGGIRRTV
jgi:CheY-like chemotaxis protein